MCDNARNTILQYQQYGCEDEDDQNNLKEGYQDLSNRSRSRHVEEETEDIEGEERNDDFRYCQSHDVLELVETLFERLCSKSRNAKSEEERTHQSRHHSHDGRYLDSEEWWKLVAFRR